MGLPLEGWGSASAVVLPPRYGLKYLRQVPAPQRTHLGADKRSQLQDKHVQRLGTHDKFCIWGDPFKCGIIQSQSSAAGPWFGPEVPRGWAGGSWSVLPRYHCNAATTHKMSPPPPSGEAGQAYDGRLTFQQMTRLIPLPDRLESGATIKRFMSARKPWAIGDDVPLIPGTLAYGARKSFRGRLQSPCRSSLISFLCRVFMCWNTSIDSGYHRCI